jgi:hypothetical protein
MKRRKKDSIGPEEVRCHLREFAHHARRTAASPDRYRAAHVDLLARQVAVISAVRKSLNGQPADNVMTPVEATH